MRKLLTLLMSQKWAGGAELWPKNTLKGGGGRGAVIQWRCPPPKPNQWCKPIGTIKDPSLVTLTLTADRSLALSVLWFAVACAV